MFTTMNAFYSKLQEITLFELEQFNQEVSNLNEMKLSLLKK